MWTGNESEHTALLSGKSNQARQIVLLTKQVALKSRALLMASRWKGAQKYTAATVDSLLKTKPVPLLQTLLEYYQTLQ